MPQVETQWPGIVIESKWQLGPKDPFTLHKWYAATLQALRKIETYQIGKDLLGIIAKRNAGIGTKESGKERVVIIRPQKEGGEGASTAAWKLGDRLNVKKTIAGGRSLMMAGKGSKTVIYYHNHATSDQIYTRLSRVHTPAWLALAHELIHAMHHLGGNQYGEEVSVDGVTMKREEIFTTGIGPYKNTRISENAFRREAGITERTDYYFPGDAVNFRALSPDVPGQGYWTCSVLQELLGE